MASSIQVLTPWKQRRKGSRMRSLVATELLMTESPSSPPPSAVVAASVRFHPIPCFPTANHLHTRA